jgi:hypothetical protein
LAVLATVTVLVLNPAELFEQARDSQRLSDLGSLKGAISLYLTTASSPSISTNGFACESKFSSDKASVANPFTGGVASTYTQTATTTQAVDGTGWVPVNFSSMTGGSPLSVLPRDPNQGDATLYYAYACSDATTTSLTFELNAKMESARYSTGADDVTATDGGNQATRYETGTYPSLAL